MPCSNRSSDASIPHGSIEGYTNHECNCPPCSGAWAGYMRDYRRRNRLTINARRRAQRRAAVRAATGEPYDLDDLISEELNRDNLT